jgi:D-threonate/D-erythronate kinase
LRFLKGGYDVSFILQNVQALRNDGNEIIVLDALDNEDLKVIAESIAQLDEKVLIVGTAGLAEFLPDALHLRDSLAVLSIIGSVSDVTRKQIEYAKERNDLDIYHYSFETMLDDQLNQQFKDQIIKALASKKHVVIQSATQLSDVSHAENLGKDLGLSSYEVSDFIAKKMGVLTGEVMKASKHDIGGVFITGGDTLIKIANELGVQGMEIKEEVLPAIPLGRFISDQYNHLNVVTKAGGFGSVEAFNGILKHLMNS